MKLRLTLTALLALSLHGCMTQEMWEEDKKVEKITFHPITSDQVHSFGIVNKDNDQLEKGSIVMMGEKYWFVINAKDSKDLTPILNVKLDKKFQIADAKKYKKDLKALPVVVNNEKEADFTTDFCLRYDTQKADEIAKLKNLSFETGKGRNNTVYHRCVHAKGKYYATPKNLPADYKFEQSIPVSIGYTTSRVYTSPGKVIGTILMTPLTLTFDALTPILFIPAMMIGGGDGFTPSF